MPQIIVFGKVSMLRAVLCIHGLVQEIKIQKGGRVREIEDKKLLKVIYECKTYNIYKLKQISFNKLAWRSGSAADCKSVGP